MVCWVNNKYKQCSHTRRSTMCWKWGNLISKCVAYHIHWMRTATESRRWSRWARKAAGTSFAGDMDTATWASNFNSKFFQVSTLLLLLVIVLLLLLLLLLLLDHLLMKLLLLLLLNPAPTPQAHHQPRLCRLLILILLLLRTAMWIHSAPSSTGGHASPSLLRYRYCCCCRWVNNAASYLLRPCMHDLIHFVYSWSFWWPSRSLFQCLSPHLISCVLLLILFYYYSWSFCYLSLSLSLIIFHLVLQSTDSLFVRAGMAYTLASWSNNSPAPPPEWLNP